METVRRTDGDEVPVSGSTGGNSAPILPRDPPAPCPLSFGQQRLWFLEQLFPNNPVYNVPRAVRMTGALDVEALRRTLDAIVDRHEAIRTTFAVVDGELRQVVAPSLTVALPVDDLSGLPGEERDAEAHRLVAEAARRPFDLEQGPLLRAKLLKLGEEEHILVLTMHHIITDGRSSEIFNREMEAVYEAFSTGKPSPLPDLPIQYADYAIWQRRAMQGEALKSELAYWRRRLDGAPSVLELPADRPRPTAPTSRGARQRWSLSKPLTEALKALSRREGVTLFMTLLAAFDVLLHRYTGQEDIVVGVSINGRTRVETEGLIGFFLNMLPMRTDHSGDPSFRELLGRVREIALGAYAHQDLPFDRLLEELRPERGVRHLPLFQVMLGLQNPAGFTMVRPGWKRDLVDVYTETTKFDISLLLLEVAEGLQLCFEYDTDLFDASTIERMAGHFQVLLEGIVADPTRRISALPLLTDGERHRLLVEWNDTKKGYPADKCIHQLFEAQVERTPEAVAVVSEDMELTYRELNCRANQLSHHLKGLGVGPEVLVGICMERSLEMIIGLLGILKAGGAYVPLDPTYPKERISLMLEDIQTPVLLTQKKVLGRLLDVTAIQNPKSKLDNLVGVCLDTDWEAIARESEENPASGVTASNLAYVIYTSGSTGRPKGAQIIHDSLLNLVFWHQRAFAVTAADRATQLAGPGFDAAVWELWPYLTAGASVHLSDEANRITPESLRDWLVTQGITICFLPTVLTQGIMALEWPPETALRVLLTGGDTLHHKPPPALPFMVVNNYGPTESTVVATSGPVLTDEHPNRLPPIGRPIANTQ
ncbi:MAG: condensation domain-containing protein, partial [Gemmatimonadetes bacterium]|nr:condensation domain-containing protein [Gemmatimonadota bacterium]